MDFLTHLGIDRHDPRASSADGDDAGLRITTGEQHANTNGTVHGGLLATILDAVMGEASRSELADGQSTATVSMTVTYLRPGKIGQELTASAEIRQQGESLVLVEGEVVDAEGRAVAQGVGTYTVLEG